MYQVTRWAFCFYHRALYGLKESARLWFNTFKNFLLSLSFKKSAIEPCVFVKKLIVSIFVDDTLSTGPPDMIKEFRKTLHSKFRISTDGGKCKQFLSIRFQQNQDGIYLDQDNYLNDKLQLYSKHISTNPKYQVASPLLPNFQELLIEAESSVEVIKDYPYREMVGSLVYLANGTRFDITAPLSIVSRFNNNPKRIHCERVSRIYQYLRGCRKSLFSGMQLEKKGYCDASYANLEDYSSLAGYCFKIGMSMYRGDHLKSQSKHYPQLNLNI
jgi:hypothetical protein